MRTTGKDLSIKENPFISRGEPKFSNFEMIKGRII